MPHEHKPVTYKPGKLPNPFQQGQDRAYGDILLDKTRKMRWWRGIIGVGFLILFAFAMGLFYYAISLQKTVPVLVNVMPTGEAVYLGEVRQAGALQVPESAILYQIRKFISSIRSVSIDSQVLYNNIDDCYSMVTSAYEPIMTRMLRADSPFNLVGRVRRNIEIETALRVTASSYQVDWVETTIESGNAPRNRKYRGLLTVKLLPPEPSFIKKNPLGIFIDSCEWTEL
jgi:type IV secretion system protein VirB5